jgi:asparagine synthase (glutamine-hydrolysing)
LCGFVGLFKVRPSPWIDPEKLQNALARIQHRGPDGMGVFQNDWLALGHARLAVIDPSDAAKQPMMDRSGRYVIVMNGEIYNFRQLFDDYCDDDETVNRHSDTSVLLALYRRFGKDCVRHLNGMFAFAIADLQQMTLFIARDRFGEKPLYWLRDGTAFVFSSELRGLKALISTKWRMDPESVALYHMVGSIPPPKTIYHNVFAIRPGHWMSIRANGDIFEGNYWTSEQSVSRRNPDTSCASYPEVVENTRTHLLEAVQSRMVSDVEVGLFLSGGYDSGALLGILNTLKLTPIKTLCLDFPHPKFSEFPIAEITARQFNGVLCRKIISPDIFIKDIPNFFACMDQPTCDGYNSYFVSQAAKDFGIKVWLSGVGGDELFGGYPSFSRITSLKWLTLAMQAVLPTSLVDGVAPRLFNHLRVSRLFHLADRGSRTTLAYQMCRNPLPWRNALKVLNPSLRKEVKDIDSLLSPFYPNTDRLSDDFQRATELESTVYLRSQLLRDLDNFSMAHSIELRAPYLDHRLFEYVMGLPEGLKKRKGTIKPLLTESLPIPLPQEVHQQGKRGFTFPVETWLRGHLTDSFGETALDKGNASFWDLDVVSAIWSGYLAGKVNWGIVWNLFAFSYWVRVHDESL